MALVARIAQIHRARLKVESDGRSGTTVRITFNLPEGGRNEQNV